MRAPMRVLLLLFFFGAVKVKARPQGAQNIIANIQSQVDRTNIVGNDNTAIDAADVKPQAILDIKLLNGITQEILGGTLGGVVPAGTPAELTNIIGNSQSQNQVKNTIGSGNTEVTGADVKPQIIGSVGILNDVTQGIFGGGAGGDLTNIKGNVQTQKDVKNTIGSGNIGITGADAKPQLITDVRVLDDVTQLILGGGAGSGNSLNALGNIQEQETSSNIVGDKNLNLDLIGLDPQILLPISALSDTNQIIAGSGAPGGIAQNLILNQQTQDSEFVVQGDKNTAIQALDLKPQILAQVDVLDETLQAIGLSDAAGVSGSNRIENIQSRNDRTVIEGNDNFVVQLIKIAPQVILKASVLDETTQAIEIIGNPDILLNGKETEIDCENILQDVQEKNVEIEMIGDNNFLLRGVDADPQILLDLNILSRLFQRQRCLQLLTTTTAAPTTLTMPPTTAPPTTAPPTTAPPTTAPPTTAPPTTAPPTTAPPTTAPPTTAPPTTAPPTTAPPTTAPPTTAPPTTAPPTTAPPTTAPPTTAPPTTIPPTTTKPPRRCFRRICRKWRTRPKYECFHGNQYPPARKIRLRPSYARFPADNYFYNYLPQPDLELPLPPSNYFPNY